MARVMNMGSRRLAFLIVSGFAGWGCELEGQLPEPDASTEASLPDDAGSEGGAEAAPNDATDDGVDAVAPNDASEDRVDAAAPSDATDDGVDAVAPNDASEDVGLDATLSSDSASGDGAVLEAGGGPDATQDASPNDAGPASDPLSIQPSRLTMQAMCGATPQGNFLTITNVSDSAVAWSLTGAGAAGSFGFSPTGSTLAPSAVATVTVTSPPIPQNPPNVGTFAAGAVQVTSTLGGQTFSDSVFVNVMADGCMGSLTPTGTVDFGDVRVGSTGTSSVVTNFSGGCVSASGFVQDNSGNFGPASTNPDFRVTGVRPNYTITFAPQSPGVKTAQFSMFYVSTPACQPTPTIVLTGTGVLAPTDAGAQGDGGT